MKLEKMTIIMIRRMFKFHCHRKPQISTIVMGLLGLLSKCLAALHSGNNLWLTQSVLANKNVSVLVTNRMFLK